MMKINPGTPGASPPPPGPQTQAVLLGPSSLSPNVGVSELVPSITRRATSRTQHYWRLTVTGHL